MNKTIFITGATAGFGEAIALIFAENNWNLIITGRRKDRLEKLEDRLKEEFKVNVLSLCFDVRDKKACEEAMNSLPENFQKIDVLVNNAGLASGFGTIDEGDFEDWDKMIDTNIKGLLYVSRLIIPFMKKQQSGHIINIASIAGKEVYLRGNVYCATKHAVDALSRAMRIDLLPYGIKVTNIAPGAAETEFSIVRNHGDTEKAAKVYEGFEPLVAEDIADVTYFAATRPAHVCINDLVIMPSAQANTSHLLRKGV
jgi:3-hydroxy acid dehydrogenase / malonic semialdehyde reductase